MQLVYQKKNLDLLKQGPRGIDGRLLYPASRGYINFFQFAVIVCLLGSSHRENVDSARKVDDYRNFPKLFAETRLECVWKNSRNAELRVFVLINAAQWSTWLSAWNLAFLLLFQLLYALCVKTFNTNRYISKSYTKTKATMTEKIQSGGSCSVNYY